MQRSTSAKTFLGLLLVAALAGCASPQEAPDPGNVLPFPAGVARFDSGHNLLEMNASDAFGLAEYVMLGEDGPEPNMGVSQKSGAVFVNAYNNVMRSKDAGKTWETVYTWPLTNNDPMFWQDPVTDRLFQVPMFPILTCSSIVFSDDDGESWIHRPLGCPAFQPMDHQKLASGKPGPKGPPHPEVPYPTVLYFCYNQLLTTSCMMSYDGGLTWPVHEPIWGPQSDGQGCAGQNGHPTASHQGVMVVPKVWGCDALYLVISEDSGLTWRTVKGPKILKESGETIDPEVAFTPDGTMYALWQDGNHRSYMARTKDLGVKWDGPWDVTPPNVNSTVFAALSAGDNGRVAMGFLGATGPDSKKHASSVGEAARWHLYIVTSEDADQAAPTFTSYQVTPAEDPVQIGTVWIGGGGNGDRNLLDFIDSAVAPDGTFYVVYADGCTEAGNCAKNKDAGPGDSRGSEAAIGVLRNWSLKAQPPAAKQLESSGNLDLNSFLGEAALRP